MKYYHPESRWYDAHERKNGRSLGPRHFILKQKKIDLWKGGSINEREFEKNIIYIFNSFKYVIQHLFISTLTILTEQEIMHFNKQNTIACSLQPSVITSMALGNPPGLRGCSSWEGDYHTCQSSLLRLPTALRWVTLAWGGHRGASVDPLLPQPYPIQTTPVEHSEVL